MITKETNELLDFVVTLIKAIDESMEDKKINLKDVGQLFKVLPTIRPAFDNVGVAFDELLSADNEDAKLVATSVMEALELDNPEEGVEAAVRILVTAGNIAWLIKKIKKTNK